MDAAKTEGEEKGRNRGLRPPLSLLQYGILFLEPKWGLYAPPSNILMYDDRPSLSRERNSTVTHFSWNSVIFIKLLVLSRNTVGL